jgi:hypothetical protein
MSLPRLLFRVCLGAGALGLAGCAVSTPQSRIARHPDDFAALSDRQKALVQQGNVEQGMPKPAVYFAWGSPDRVSNWVKNGTPIERWTFLDYHPVFTHHWGMGWGYGRGYYDRFGYGGPDVYYVPYADRRVDFRNGRVINWESRAR